MSSIRFVSHEEFSEDLYISELVYLLIDEKYRVAYVRKQAKNGGKFWTVPTVSVTKDRNKVYFDSFMQDSAFLEQDIKSFLENRSWEQKAPLPSCDYFNPMMDNCKLPPF